MKSSKKVFFALLFFTLLGLVSSVLMTDLHYKIAKTGFEEKSFCHVSDFFDCDTALASRYSRIGSFLTSEIGILYYLFLFVGILYAWASEKKRPETVVFFLLAGILALGYSLVMAYLSLFQLGILCLLCLATYLANFGLFFLLPKVTEVRLFAIPRFMFQNWKPMVRNLVVVLLTTGIGLLFFKGLKPEIHKAYSKVPREAVLRFFYSQPQQEMPIPERPFWGKKEAEVSIVEFSDFQCPFCRVAAFTLKPYLKEFRSRIRLTFLNYPLDSSCNPALTHSMHPTACLAAKASLCAWREKKFWEYHDGIFKNQKRLSRDVLLKLANEVGLESSHFDRCLASDEIGDLLREDVALGAKMEVHGTPAVFINGRPLRHWSDPEQLRVVIESEISRLSP